MFQDNENRLVAITNSVQAPALLPMMPKPSGGWLTLLTYDGQGRLRVREEYYAYYSSYYLTNTTRYIYDGNRVIQERDAANTPTVSYTRGSDLSGSLEGAGGIGGLLARSTGNGSTWTSHAYYHADGNGNITALLDGIQSVVAAYRYDPFGNALAKTGTLADANVYRFSSKELHAKSGMYYYLYRFYDPNLQRWINRDPLGEPGFEAVFAASAGSRSVGFAESEEGPNLFAFVGNDGVSFYDDYGNGKRPARNRDRSGHGPGGDTKGGGRGDKHSRAQGHGGREKPNFTRVNRRGKPINCGVGLPLMFAFDAILQEMPDHEFPDDEGKCPKGTCPVKKKILWWDYIECVPCA